MRLYLFRHGIAIDHEHHACPADPERWLTPEGKKKTRLGAMGLKSLGVEPGLILTSPYTRARETAEIVADVLGVSELAASDQLLPEGDPHLFFESLPSYGDVGDILCAGHAPNLDYLLATGIGVWGKALTGIKKAGAACIELERVDQLPGVLVWLIQAKPLRLLADVG